MRTLRNLAFVLLIVSLANADATRVSAFDAYTDWVTYNQSVCDGGFGIADPNDPIVQDNYCSCAGSPPSACWTYIGGTGVCGGAHDAAVAHCSNACGLQEAEFFCNGYSAEWWCYPRCSDGEGGWHCNC